ncbi:MAG TPA: hypothetical protein VES01_02215 [Dermatophilaceae bacterium]|nr:hypothetical protein [Dermatophilaceae bacterium]
MSNVAPGAGLSVVLKPASSAKVDLTWAATSSTYATGHEVLRGGVSQAILTPRSISTWTDENPGPGARTYQVRARAGNWQSTSATASLTPAC